MASLIPLNDTYYDSAFVEQVARNAFWRSHPKFSEWMDRVAPRLATDRYETRAAFRENKALRTFPRYAEWAKLIDASRPGCPMRELNPRH